MLLTLELSTAETIFGQLLRRAPFAAESGLVPAFHQPVPGFAGAPDRGFGEGSSGGGLKGGKASSPVRTFGPSAARGSGGRGGSASALAAGSRHPVRHASHPSG